MNTYNWRVGTYLKVKGDDAEDVMKELHRIKLETGNLDPSTIVEYAKNPNSILHKYFTWDDTEAARKYREQEARYLLAAIVIIPYKEQNKNMRISYRAIVHTGNKYQDTMTVITSPSLRKIYVAEARKELLAFKNKYAALKILIKYVDEMISVLDQIGEEEIPVAN